MAFNSNIGRQSFVSGAGQTDFSFNFKIFEATDMEVYKTPSGQAADDTADILTYNIDYTVTIDGDDGGTITLLSGASSGDTIVALRALPTTRTVSYVTNGDLLASTLNEDQNYQTYLIVDNYLLNSGFISIPKSSVGISVALPGPLGDSYIKWDAIGTSLENDTTIPDAVIQSASSASAASNSATEAQLRAWEAEAEKLTADSYATEAEDTFVNLVTSDGDGTFTYTPTTEYSALHWATKAATFNPASYYLATEIDTKARTWYNKAATITPTSDADYTLTADQNTYGRLILVDGSWTVTHNIIIDNTERSFLVDNSSGTYTATVKTSAGTGIPVLSGTKVWLLCDGTNVIESVDSSTLAIASTAQAQAGTDDTTVLSPLKLREGLNASGTAPIYACRAWVNFNGTGTVAIRASGNVSSITDNGTGDYTVNFTTAMTDANYFASACLPDYNSASCDDVRRNGTPATTSYRFRIGAGATAGDCDFVGLSIFR
jgi:hypothetical protein